MASGAFYNPLIPSTIIDNDLIEGAFSFEIDTTQTHLQSSTFSPEDDNQFHLPLISDGTYNFVAHWGDGTTDTITSWNQAETLHTYTEPGVYLVQLVGTVTGFMVGEGQTRNRNKLITIYQWGGLTLTDTNGSFMAGGINAPRLNVVAKDVPQLATSGVNTGPLRRLFGRCRSLSGVGANWNWDIKDKGQIGGCFAQTQFNGDISMWDTSTVNTFRHPSNDQAGLFQENAVFNGDINTKVINEGLPNEYIAWDTSNVTNMVQTFLQASSYNQYIGDWNTANVTDMQNMFHGATVFNQNIGSWNTGNVTNMSSMFLVANAFNQNIGGWDVSKVTSIRSMFQGNTQFNNGGSPDINNWDTSSITDMRNVFRDGNRFNQPIGNWDTSNVTTMEAMFWLQNTPKFNQNIGNWNVGKCTDFREFMSVSPTEFDAENLDAIYNGWIANELIPTRTLRIGTANFTSNAVEGRALLTRAN